MLQASDLQASLGSAFSTWGKANVYTIDWQEAYIRIYINGVPVQELLPQPSVQVRVWQYDGQSCNCTAAGRVHTSAWCEPCGACAQLLPAVQHRVCCPAGCTACCSGWQLLQWLVHGNCSGCCCTVWTILLLQNAPRFCNK